MGPFRHYTRQSLTTMLNANGLETVEVLPNVPKWHQSYTRHYGALRGRALTVGKLFGGGSVFKFRWPSHKERAIDRLETKLKPRQERDATLRYSELDTSTFLIAQRPVTSPPSSRA